MSLIKKRRIRIFDFYLIFIGIKILKQLGRLIIPWSVSIQIGTSYGTFYWIQILPIKCHYANFVYHWSNPIKKKKKILHNLVIKQWTLDQWPKSSCLWTFYVLFPAVRTICKCIVTLICWYADISSCASSQWPCRRVIYSYIYLYIIVNDCYALMM